MTVRLPLPQAYADPAFLACVHEAYGLPELVTQFDRLYGADLSRRRPPIIQMVDTATGKADDDMRAFMRFLHDSVYLRLEDAVIDELRLKAIAALSDHPV